MFITNGTFTVLFYKHIVVVINGNSSGFDGFVSSPFEIPTRFSNISGLRFTSLRTIQLMIVIPLLYEWSITMFTDVITHKRKTGWAGLPHPPDL
jgi:hypothetical protein